jgi:RIO kinase 1
MKEALQVLLSDGVLEEIVSRLKSGKEADVYLVVHKGEIVAAKIYKERQQRSFKNNADYKEGRLVRNSRTARAIAKGSRFGQSAAEDAWKTTEADALSKLFAAGVRVPQPVMYYEGVLLMEVVLDPEGHPAPRLIDAPLTAETAAAVYFDLRNQATKMLCADVIHGDLSPYNILMAWNGPTIIDFPQMVNPAANSRAEFFFKRDMENLWRFFSGIDPSLKSRAGDAHEIWRAYTRRELTPDFEPTGRMAPPEERRMSGPPREHRGPPREHRGPPGEFRGPPRENRGPPGEHRGPPRENRGPPRDNRFPPREHAAPRAEAVPAPAAITVTPEDEFALLRQGGGERPRVQDLARAKGGGRGGPRNGRGGPGGRSNGPSGGHAPRGPHTAPPQGAPREHRGPRPEGAAPHRGPRPEGARPQADAVAQVAQPHGGHGGHAGRPQGQGPRQGGGREQGPRHGRGGDAAPQVTYVAKSAPSSGPGETSHPSGEARRQGGGHHADAPHASTPRPPAGNREGSHHHRRRG